MGSESPSDVQWMTRALEMAELAGSRGEVPVGAVLTKGDEMVAEGQIDLDRTGNFSALYEW